jgi:signal peptidase II
LKKLKLSEYILYSAVILSGIGIDQLTKWLAATYLKQVGTLPLIENALHLTYHTNKGMAFGMLETHRWIFMSVSTLTILALVFLLYSGYVRANKFYTVSLSLIISGGIGNMIDRVFLGYVIDFIDFRLIDFAIFNGADSFVCVGAGLLIFALLRDVIAEAKNQKKQDENK